jgi:hypothetical protein
VRLSDLGDAALCSENGDAIGVRAAVLIAEGTNGVVWGGQVWPYRPLALTPGRYLLRVRGEDLGLLTVRAVHISGDREVGDFTGVGPPSARLRRLAGRGGGAQPGRNPRYPRVARDIDAAPVAALAGSLAAGLRRILRRGSRE